MAILSLCQLLWIRPIIIGQTIFVIGVFQGNYGGDIGFQPIIVGIADIWRYLIQQFALVQSVTVPISSKTRIH